MSRETAVRGVFVLLIALGLTLAAMRAFAVGDLYSRIEPVRPPIFAALGLTEPDPVRRAAFMARGDQKFADYKATTLLHILTGAGFLVLVSLQFTRRIRTRAPRIHRIVGRVAILLASTSAVSGLFFGLVNPVGGPAESVIISVVGLFLLVAIGLAFRHIRAGRVAQHREWMLRAAAAAIAVAMTRIVGVPLDLWLAPRGVDPSVILSLALALGWVVTMTGAEWWIHVTRVRRAGPVTIATAIA